MFKKIKAIFKKEKTFACIVWNGKTMSYPNLTKEEIDDINNNPKYKNWSVTLQKEEI
ncbi:hypothetical protein [Halarcobacter anaerophilus]|uniref:hypothetical protein n=1 Tax=Halarcobacter anaerophilus TaxID=877500 RepID=UPI000AF8867C|nr:hypothetical protein [Halarcobacter anaerophilus]